MRALLITSFNEALLNYQRKAYRGYAMGFFTWMRHSFVKTKKLASLEELLLQCSQDEEALYLVVEHLLSKWATFNHHSFNSYFIDALKRHLGQIEWDCFTPMAIKTYHGTLYRGSSQPPEKIFKEGFKELRISDLFEDYLKFKNKKIGISTTKCFDIAKRYALKNNRSRKTRYIYEINYRDEVGFDILETGKSRGLSFHSWLHKDRYSGFRKMEVNIKDNIKKTDIVGAWIIQENGNLERIENSYYQRSEFARLRT